MSPLTSLHLVETTLSSSLIQKLGESIELLIGLHFPPARRGDLLRGISAAAHKFGFDDVNQCAEWLFSTTLSQSQIETLAGCLAIGETYFFRDKRVFEILETTIVPELLRSKSCREQKLRIWSAGCASGEEPYSLAILLAGLLPVEEDWKISILATDISPLSLEKAAQGVYGEWSFRETAKWIKERWFEHRGHSYAIAPRIRQMVNFSFLNLADDSYPGIVNQTNAMDIIFCRNVLMYFSRGKSIAIIENLTRCLVEGGWLVIGPIDAIGTKLSHLLSPVSFPGATLYKRAKAGNILQPIVDLARTQPVFPPAKWKKVHFSKKRQVAGSNQLKKVLPIQSGAPTTATCEMIAPIRFLANQGRLGDALVLSETAIQTDKLNCALHYLQATILQEMNRPDDAEAALKRAIYIDQEFAVAHFSLGHLLHRRGKVKEAGKHLAKACSLLKSYGEDQVLPEGEGMSARRLIDLINNIMR